MNISNFNKLSPNRKVSYIKKHAVLVQRIIRSEFVISLYWSRELIFEVFYFRKDFSIFEVKSYDRRKYAA